MKSIKLFFQGFIPAFLGFSLLIMAAVLWVTPLSHNKEKPAQSYINIPRSSDNLTILAVHGEEQLFSLTLLSFEPAKGQISLHSFPTDTIINGNKLSDLWKIDSIKQMTALLSAYTDRDIHRQIVVNDRKLLTLLRYFAPISAVLESPLSLTQAELTATLEPGVHQLSAEQCFSYLKSAKNPVLRAQRCEELLCNAINENSSMSSDQLQEAFLLLLDQSETDLSIRDFDRYAELYFFLMQTVKKPAIIK